MPCLPNPTIHGLSHAATGRSRVSQIGTGIRFLAWGILGAVRVFAVVAIVAGILAGVSAAAGSRPSIRIVQSRPLVVAGSHFRAGERVKVVAHLTRTIVRHVVARHGSFRVNLGMVPVSKCEGIRIVAVGSRGSRATLKIPRSGCIPT
jgi:hypothetical protein